MTEFKPKPRDVLPFVPNYAEMSEEQRWIAVNRFQRELRQALEEVNKALNELETQAD